MRTTACLIALAFALTSADARAQDFPPLLGKVDCSRANRGCVPATLEWSPWIAGAIAFGIGERAAAAAGVGLELTTGIVDWAGPPISSEAAETKAGPFGYRAELRAGPWVYAETRGGDGAVAEGGLTLHFGTTNDPLEKVAEVLPAGMFDLRGGVGYGAFPAGRAVHYALALGWGYRVAPERATWLRCKDPAPPPRTFIDASLIRLVTTARRAPAIDAWEIALAVEISPTFVFLQERSRNAVRSDP